MQYKERQELVLAENVAPATASKEALVPGASEQWREDYGSSEEAAVITARARSGGDGQPSTPPLTAVSSTRTARCYLLSNYPASGAF